jgi:formylglycine-generating enzyme required for sulfatase activity
MIYHKEDFLLMQEKMLRLYRLIKGLFPVKSTEFDKAQENSLVAKVLRDTLPQETLQEAMFFLLAEKIEKKEHSDLLVQEVKRSMQIEFSNRDRLIGSLVHEISHLKRMIEETRDECYKDVHQKSSTIQDVRLFEKIRQLDLNFLFGEPVRARALYCPPGDFFMGASERELHAKKCEKPARKIEIRQGFFLWETPVTQEQYCALESEIVAFHIGSAWRPVENVNWHEAAAFCNHLSRRHGLSEVYDISCDGKAKIKKHYQGDAYYQAKGWRLPTEAEWEYACRANSTDIVYDEIEQIAWFLENSMDSTHVVRQKKKNMWGFYDMLGNVWEWCADSWDASAYQKKVAANPFFCGQEDERVIIRGGSYNSPSKSVRMTGRYYERRDVAFINIGFRPCLTVDSSL